MRYDVRYIIDKRERRVRNGRIISRGEARRGETRDRSYNGEKEEIIGKRLPKESNTYDTLTGWLPSEFIIDLGAARRGTRLSRKSGLLLPSRVVAAAFESFSH
ncbi:hypothetical protein V9T40_011725 [Parthenolecanium corni]|uniref:Uncharacterized protein n=1 Tax=Parthenolecanium corni TaxID=536013 RepID=A0AAN9T7D5_9HEMI